MTDPNTERASLQEVPTASPEERKRQLFDRQKALLDTFLGTGAITPAQYRKSLRCLAEKMGFPLTEPLP